MGPHDFPGPINAPTWIPFIDITFRSMNMIVSVQKCHCLLLMYAFETNDKVTHL